MIWTWPVRCLRGTVLLCGAVILQGCASDTLILGPQQATPKVELPDGAPRVSGAAGAAAREHQRMVSAFGGEYRSGPVQAQIASIVDRLRKASDLPGNSYKLTILNSPAINAFALPSGDLYVTRGLLAVANDPSEVASVLAHEMAHVTSRHAIERQELESRTVLVSRVRAEVLNNPGAAQLVRDQAQVAIASFSRQQELEADQAGIRTMARAGFDPYGAHRFLLSLNRATAFADQSGDAQRQRGIEFSSTHPSNPERIQQALMLARQSGEPGATRADDRGRWLQSLNGVVYGEEASDGFIRGRTFIHPRIGITFTAPEGFTLENSANAVLGVTAGATEALRFDSARVSDGTSLESFLRDNKIEGLALSDVQSLPVSGATAATGLARGQDWTFRIFVYRIGAQVYRLILASRAFTPETDKRFFDAFSTLRQLPAEDAAKIKPLRIRLVTANPLSTAQSVAGGMGGLDRPVERFRLINGMEPGDEVQSGRVYKVVAD